MATSSKVLFRLETLKQKALESIDSRIDRKRLEVQSFEDDTALQQRVVEWRARQEEKVSELFRSLGDTDNHRLANFKIDPIPEVDAYDLRRAERELENLESRRSQIWAKTESLVPDEDGNISLTKTQLTEFFGL